MILPRYRHSRPPGVSVLARESRDLCPATPKRRLPFAACSIWPAYARVGGACSAFFAGAALSPHRAAAALRATSVRFSGVSFVIRAFAPRRPSATAAGFFLFAIEVPFPA